MKHLHFLLGAMIVSLLLFSCKNQSNQEKAEQEATESNLFGVTLPTFEKFVAVSVDESTPIYKDASTSSPTLVEWTEEAESDMLDMQCRWSDQPGIEGYDSVSSTAWPGNVYAVLGEKGDFYKVSILSETCNLEEGYVLKSAVSDLNTDPFPADYYDEVEWGTAKVVKDGAYKGLVLYSYLDELAGEFLEVGAFDNGFVVFPDAGKIGCTEDAQATDIRIDDMEWGLELYYPTALKYESGEDGWNTCMDPQKLSDAQIEKIYKAVKERPFKLINCHFFNAAKGPWIVHFKQK